MTVMERCIRCGVVPVVVIEHAEDAVPAARAMLTGGVDVMEITMRTAAGLDSIRAVVAECPDMLVGAGTVRNLDQCKACVEAGANFIVAPGFDAEVVTWCLAHDVPVLPGCVTPTEIMAGLKLGLTTFKFFPANVYGGLKGMKALAAPFVGIQFLPTGGVNGENMAEYLASPFIAAVGGSWVCTKADISAGNWEKITTLCRQAANTVAALRAGA